MDLYARFESEFLNANSWAQRKDGVPLDLLDSLDTRDRERAVAQLLSRLDGRDTWPIDGLAHLREVSALSPLRKLLGHRSAIIRAHAAAAIFALEGDTSVESYASSLVTSADAHWGDRIDAIWCLVKFRTQSAKAALEQASRDSEFLVSYNAKRALAVYL